MPKSMPTARHLEAVLQVDRASFGPRADRRAHPAFKTRDEHIAELHRERCGSRLYRLAQRATPARGWVARHTSAMKRLRVIPRTLRCCGAGGVGGAAGGVHVPNHQTRGETNYASAKLHDPPPAASTSPPGIPRGHAAAARSLRPGRRRQLPHLPTFRARPMSCPVRPWPRPVGLQSPSHRSGRCESRPPGTEAVLTGSGGS